MKEHFLELGGLNDVQKQHDYINYINHEETLMKRYKENKSLVVSEVSKLLKDCKLKGQWSIDIMQNGSDFWLIDMARASESALSECVPKEKLKQALLEIQNDKETIQILTNLFSITGFEEPNNDAYKAIEKISEKMNIDLNKVK